jgi:hypothetical protein
MNTFVTKFDKDIFLYGLDGPGIEFGWGGGIFLTCPDRL